MAVILTIVSFMVVWSECLFFVKDPVLSVFAVFINLAKENYDYVFIEVRLFSCDMRFPTMWYLRPAKAQTRLRIRAVWSELMQVA